MKNYQVLPLAIESSNVIGNKPVPKTEGTCLKMTQILADPTSFVETLTGLGGSPERV